jgi:AcrR family transcriptional regulator
MSDVHFFSSQTSASADTEPVAPQLSVVALRERKKDQTRDALARAALALFQDKGYEATTVAEIARAANVSRRTFFRYFPTKDALLFVETDDLLERFRDSLDAREPGDEVGDPVRRACLAQASEYMRDRDQMVARARIIESSPGLSKQERQQDLLWEQAITDALLANGGRNTPNAERRARMLSGAIVGAMRAAILEWQRLEGSADLVRLTGEALDLFDLRDIDLEGRSLEHASSN